MKKQQNAELLSKALENVNVQSYMEEVETFIKEKGITDSVEIETLRKEAARKAGKATGDAVLSVMNAILKSKK